MATRKPTKPKIKHYCTEKAYDVHDVMNYIDAKYGSDCYDVFGSGKHFDAWCDAQGYGQKDPEGKKRSHSNIWFAEYQKNPDGQAKCPPYETVLDQLDKVYCIYAQPVIVFDFDKAEFSNSSDYMKEFAERVEKEFGDAVRMGNDIDDR